MNTIAIGWCKNDKKWNAFALFWNTKGFNSANKEQILTMVNEAIIDLRNDIINIIVEVCSKLTIKTLEQHQ